jgi:hypothetical protein
MSNYSGKNGHIFGESTRKHKLERTACLSIESISKPVQPVEKVLAELTRECMRLIVQSLL